MNRDDMLRLDRIAGLAPDDVTDPNDVAVLTALRTSQNSQTADALIEQIRLDGSAELNGAARGIDLSGPEGPGAALLKGLTDAQAPAPVIAQARAQIDKVQAVATLADRLPVGSSPIARDDLAAARMHRIAELAGLDAAKSTELVDGGLRLTQMDDTQLDGLVGHGNLSDAQARSVGLATSVYRLVDEDATLADRVLRQAPTGGALSDLRQLVSLDAAGWTGMVNAAGVTTPGGMSTDQYGLLLAKRVEAAYPTSALRARLGPLDRAAVAGAITAAGPVLARGADVLTRPDADLGNVDAGIREGVRTLSSLAAGYAGLGLDAVLADTTLGADERARRVTERVDVLDRFLTANQDAELVHLDLTPDSADLAGLDFVGAADELRPALVNHAKAMQRVYALTADADDAARLLKAGFASAAAIATTKLSDFVARTGLAELVAAQYFETATKTVGSTSVLLTSMIDIIRGGFGKLQIANLDPSIEEYLEKIDGYADLFGSQDYCSCSDCRSITSPAAYFVDLMRFIEQYLLDPVFTGAAKDHVLHLRSRRPDLWTLPLTCENTKTEIPQLVIVTEILERYLAGRTGFTGDPTNTDAVARHSYRERLATSTAGFALPFFLPLTRVDTYLQHFGVRRADIVRFTGGDDDRWAAAELGLSALQRSLVVTPDIDLAFLRQVYALTFTVSGALVTAFDAQLLLRPMGITRDELTDLAGSQFVSAGGTEPVTIASGKLTPASVQNDVESITGLRPSSLDRLHRLTRLWRACDGWSIRELDLVLRHLQTAGLAAGIDPAAVRIVAALRSVQRRFPMTVEDLLVLVTGVPVKAVAARRPALFDRLFNLPELVKLDGAWPQPGARFVHPAFLDDPAAAPADHVLHRLLAGLGSDAATLAELVRALAAPLGLDPSAPAEADRGFPLTAANLSLLVRHARLARMLKLPVGDLFRLLALTPSGARTHVAGPADLEALLDTHDWVRAAKRPVDDLAVVTGAPPADPAGYPGAAALAGQVLDRLATDRGLTFTDTVFTLVSGVTEAGSRAVFAANAALFTPGGDPSGGQFVLASAFTPKTALTVPASVAAAEADLRAVLLTHHAGTLIRATLATQLKLAPDKLGALLALAGVDLDAAAIVPEALGNGSTAALAAALAPVLPLVVLFGAKELGGDVVDLAAGHRDLFALADLTRLTSEAVRKVEQLRLLAAGDPARASLLVQVLGAFTAAARFAAADPAQLATVLGVDREVSVSLQAALTLPDDALDALGLLVTAAGTARAVGVGGEALRLVVADTYDELDLGADAVFAAFRAKYADEAAWATAFEPFNCRLLDARRDALAAFLVHAIHPEFERLEDLYRYFLLDIEVDGCFTTSRVVAAISSAQLYVHRVLMNLEQDRAGAVHVQPALVPRDEWEWRQHYRVWEANRKVFLWPENYLFPDLRDDKTPLFEDLEKELLQTDLDEQAVLDAYATYLDGFQEVAGLTIAGAYQEIDYAKDADVLHLFGVTPGDPATFYYRRIENVAPEGRRDGGTVWGPWRKVDVAIPVRDVAPIVHNGRLHLLWVEITTSPVNEVSDSGSRFVGYHHKMTLKFTTLRLDGRWTAPQKVRLYGTDPFGESDGVIEDPLADPNEWTDFRNAIGNFMSWGIFGDASAAGGLNDALRRLITPRYDDQVHVKARDGYTLRGLEWTAVYPERHADSLLLSGAGYQLRGYVDTFDKTTSTAPSLRLSRQAVTFNFTPHSPLLTKRNGILYYGTPSFALFDDYANAALAADRVRLDRVLDGWASGLKNLVIKDLYVAPLATVNTAQLSPINGALSDGIVDAAGDLYLLQATPKQAATWVLRRLGTTLAKQVARDLFTNGVEHLLDLDTQRTLAEAPLAFTLTGDRIVNRVNSGRLDFTGPFGTYYREIFLHIPFLIANHLNGQGKYAAAERWYRHIFDPTTSELITPDPKLSNAVNRARERDRNWRYLEFRGLTLPTLRQVLTDTSAIAAYHKDPFNPHAIARLRLSAYQKAIVMRYIDNKLDLADSLFEQFQMETVNEAMIHYATVSDLLGDRPAQLGECGDGGVEPRTYATIRPLIDKGSEFLVEAEHLILAGQKPTKPPLRKYVWEAVAATKITKSALRSAQLKAAGVVGLEEAAVIAPEMTRALYAARNAPALLAEIDVPAPSPPAPAPAPQPAPQQPQPLPQPAPQQPQPFPQPLPFPLPGPRPVPILRPQPGGPQLAGGGPVPLGRITPGDLFRDRIRDTGPLAAERKALLTSQLRANQAFTSDIDPAVGLSSMGRPGPDDLNPEALKLRETERADVSQAFQTSVRSLDALPSVVGLAAGRLGTAAPEQGEVTAGPDWKRLSVFEGPSRLRPRLIDRTPLYFRDKRLPGRFGLAFIRQVNPVFCVPPNLDLIGYWDRLEDRLWKLRNCRDITGALRRLSLFAPEIDPMALVRARAAGLSLDDALLSLGGEVPPYRFSFLLERAKSQATAVQSFGNALQGALERRDGEQLNQLRAQHQQEILDLTTKAREQERDAAANAVTAVERHRQSVENRKAYYVGLVNGSLSPEEQAERIGKHVAGAARMTEATLGFLSGALHLIPQLGSPFAMKYGGVETGWSAKSFAVGARAVGDFADALAASAAVEAGFNRRDQGWRQQIDAADDDLAEIEVQLTGARLRRDIAEQAIAVHTRSVEQAEDVLEMYREHFTGAGLYTFLATVLQRLHREAFNTALSMARMAEQAYRFERGDDTISLAGPYWDAEHAGLSAGAQLVVDLQRLERRYVETNSRDLEIDQSFSLSQVDPAALVRLKTTGECDFTLPEVLFDVAYPGHYRRRIKSARLTVPCVTGPYANVSATLELTESWLRAEPRLGEANIRQVPNARASAIATSTGQSDPGVFELNFRDERYMPFEGAGAVSAWHLRLPKAFRQFDYATINDVVLRLAYTARSDGGLRTTVETLNAGLEGTILKVLSERPLTHVVSLRNAFSNTFNRLLHSPAGTDAALTLTQAHLPFFVSGRDLTVTGAKLVVRPQQPGTALGALAFTIDGAATGAFTPDATLGDLPAADITAAFAGAFAATHTLRVSTAGDLAPDDPRPGDQSALDAGRLADVLIVLEVTVA